MYMRVGWRWGHHQGRLEVGAPPCIRGSVGGGGTTTYMRVGWGWGHHHVYEGRLGVGPPPRI